MISLSYQTSLHNKIASLLPQYHFSRPLWQLIATISETDAKHLYSLVMNKRKDELKQFIEAHI